MELRSGQSSMVTFYVNGKKIEDENIDPEWTLLYYLRNKLRLCGTKLGCGEGGCGACTVMVSKYDRTNKKEIHIPVNSCLAPVCSMHGLAVTTVEGIGSTKTRLHPVQERIAKAHGSQCGFCTPGIVMSMYTLLRNKPKPKMKELEVAFQGNLCRCTGYRPIIEGYKTFTEEWEISQHMNGLVNGNGVGCAMGDKCCKLINNNNGDEVLFKQNEFIPYDPSQELIFPPELKLTNIYDKQYLVIKGKKVTWYRPTNLDILLKLKTTYPNAKIVVGNTEIGVETKFKNMLYPVIIQPSCIPELTQIIETEKGVKIGASATLIDIENFLRSQIIKKQPESKTRIFQTMVEMLNWFAGKQIRSVGALGSNIMTGSPISDMIPILLAARCKLDLLSEKRGERTVVLDANFFVGYRKSIVEPDEILLAINIPFTDSWTYFEAFKQARRREDDIAIVNEAVWVKFVPNSNIIEDISFGFGGMSFKTVDAPKTQKKLKRLPWNKQLLTEAYNNLLEDLPLAPSAPGGMISYRKSLVLSLFLKIYLTITTKLRNKVPGVTLEKNEVSGVGGYTDFHLNSSQYFTVIPETREIVDSVQKPIVHRSAFKQATGEAQYCDDIPAQEGELYCAFVLSTKAYANITTLDASEALNIEGVHAFISAKDMKDYTNKWGSVIHDEKVFYSDRVTSQGQIIALIVAESQNIAQTAAKKVKVVYEELEPVIITIEDAIKYNSFTSEQSLVQGDVDLVMKNAPHVLEGECRIGGQEQFYFETQACLVIPGKEDDEIEVWSSTQNPTENSKLISEVLRIPQNKIVTRVKRIGGGFGGKESKSNIIILPLAVAAKILNRPLRVMLDRDEDIIMTGGRHPFYFKYKVAFDDNGKILGVDAQMYNNCGYSVDLSHAVLQRAITHFDNAYNVPVCRIKGFACRTNLTSNTAFRGFGGPQGMYMAETIASQIAIYLNKDVEKVSEINLYKEGDRTCYNQQLINCTLDKCWKECLEMSNYIERKQDLQKFNKENQYKKRGMSIIPTKFGIAFTATFLNQGGALILVYTDGSVLLTTGAVEMGQGVHTKMIQVASRALEIPVEKIHISETATDKVPNTSPTAASVGSDVNGMAVLEACTKIKKRLQPFKKANPNGTWEDWVRKAYFERVSLFATGFYKTPGLEYDPVTNKGNIFDYFTYGVGCTEVEIDTLTGDHRVIRTDIVMDLGESLNPAIDIGQIEGAFMQGYGLFVLEELVYSPTGTNFTRGPGTYKIPGFADIPATFNVSLLKGVSNPRAVFSSKAVGEPPLFIASSAFFAIKNAIQAARIENGINGYFRLDAPATAERIRMACVDSITSMIEAPKPGTYIPWNIVV